MILDKKPLPMADVVEFVKEEGNDNVIAYLKKFNKTSKDKAEKLKESLIALNNPRLKESDIVKLIDFLPQDQKDVNKVVPEAGLNEEEINSILNIIKGG